MIGILCEKPSARKNFAKAFGIDGTNIGKYEGEDIELFTSVGHIFSFPLNAKGSPDITMNLRIKSPEAIERYNSWDIKHLPWSEKDFAWIKQLHSDKKDVFRALQDLKKCSEVIIATDDDPTGEGELLAWEILDELGIDNPSRMYFEDESKPKIIKAFNERKKISRATDNDLAKAEYRSRFDYLTMQYVRILTFFARRENATTFGEVVRGGRLKSVMVSLVGNQLDELRAYKKIPFYGYRFKDENGNVYTYSDEPVFKKREDVPKGKYEESEVKILSKEKKSSPPSKFIDLAKLTGLIVPHGFKAKEVLEVYQKMYEAGIVSYPRTEDTKITSEQFKELLPLADKIADLVGVDKSLLTHKTPRDTHIKEGLAHGANRPGLTVPKSMSVLDSFGSPASLIYTILAKSFLACLCEDYEYEKQTGCLIKYPMFTGECSIPLNLGYKQVYADEMSDTGKGLGSLAKPFVHEGFPPKPVTPTVNWLMNKLKKFNVGTGATRVSTYNECLGQGTSRKSAIFEDNKGKISMTRIGWIAYILSKNTKIADTHTTEKIYSQMQSIGKGFEEVQGFDELEVQIKTDLETMRQNSDELKKELEKRGIEMAEFKEKEKYSGIYEPTGAEVSFTRTWGSHRFSDDDCERLLGGETITVELPTKKGGTYEREAWLGMRKFKNSKGESIEYFGVNFPIKGHICVEYNGETIDIPSDYFGYELSDEDIETLTSGGKVEVEYTNKMGNTCFDVVKIAKDKAGFWGLKAVGK